jgi:hypothetical protein
MGGKLGTVIDQIEHGHHVFRAYWKNAFLKQYEKFSTLLRNELFYAPGGMAGGRSGPSSFSSSPSWISVSAGIVPGSAVSARSPLSSGAGFLSSRDFTPSIRICYHLWMHNLFPVEHLFDKEGTSTKSGKSRIRLKMPRRANVIMIRPTILMPELRPTPGHPARTEPRPTIAFSKSISSYGPSQRRICQKVCC